MSSSPQHVAVPVGIWHAVIEVLISELPMKKVEGLVGALRQSKPITMDAPTDGASEGS